MNDQDGKNILLHLVRIKILLHIIQKDIPVSIHYDLQTTIKGLRENLKMLLSDFTDFEGQVLEMLLRLKLIKLKMSVLRLASVEIFISVTFSLINGQNGLIQLVGWRLVGD